MRAGDAALDLGHGRAHALVAWYDERQRVQPVDGRLHQREVDAEAYAPHQPVEPGVERARPTLARDQQDEGPQRPADLVARAVKASNSDLSTSGSSADSTAAPHPSRRDTGELRDEMARSRERPNERMTQRPGWWCRGSAASFAGSLRVPTWGSSARVGQWLIGPPPQVKGLPKYWKDTQREGRHAWSGALTAKTPMFSDHVFGASWHRLASVW